MKITVTAEADSIEEIEDFLKALVYAPRPTQAAPVEEPRPTGAMAYRRRSDGRWVAAVRRNGRRIAAYGPTPEYAEQALAAKLEHGATDALSPVVVTPVEEPVAEADSGQPQPSARVDVPGDEEPAPAFYEDPEAVRDREPTPPPSDPVSLELATSEDPSPASPDHVADDGKKVDKRYTPEFREAARERMKAHWARRREVTPETEGALPSNEGVPTESYGSGTIVPPVENADLVCICPMNWWTYGSDDLGRLVKSEKHGHLCPLHAHRFVLPPRGDGSGVWVGKCVCGATKTHKPYGDQPPVKVEVPV